MHSFRLSLWMILAIVCAAAAVLTAVSPTWLESAFGIDPDGGSGAAEWLAVAAFATLSIASSVRVAVGVRFAR